MIGFFVSSHTRENLVVVRVWTVTDVAYQIRFLQQSMVGFIEFEDLDKAINAFNRAQEDDFKVAGKRIYFQYAHPREKVPKEESTVVEDVRAQNAFQQRANNNRKMKSPKLSRADLDNNWRKH